LSHRTFILCTGIPQRTGGSHHGCAHNTADDLIMYLLQFRHAVVFVNILLQCVRLTTYLLTLLTRLPLIQNDKL